MAPAYPFPLLSFSTLLLLASYPHLLDAASSSLPKIDFGALGTVGVVGSFAGLQLYDPSSPPTTYSSTASTLIARSDSGQLNNVGATNEGGRISAVCQTTSGLVFVGGLFTSLGGVPAVNMAQYNSGSRMFSPLSTGLDGEVLALSCNGTTIYAGGRFAGPVGASSDVFAGHVAAWSTASGSWSPLPFAGLNGAVESIAPSQDGKSLFFGGAFSTVFSNSTAGAIPSTSNVAVFPSLGSSLVPISLNGSDFVASPTSYTSGFGRPQHVFCPKGADGVGTSWLMVDGTVGSFIVRFYRPLAVRGIRIGNTFFEGRGTANFSLTSIPNDVVLNLTYASNPADPRSPTTTCMANCPLAHDPAVPYQDFLFPENTEMTGFELVIFGFYGAGAGLHLLQLLSEGAYAYAVAANNYSPCAAGLGESTQSLVSTVGNWTEKDVNSLIPGTVTAVLIGNVPGGTTPANAPSLTWSPYVISDGAYEIYFQTPGCVPANTCPERTSVTVVVSPAQGGSTTTTTIDQTNSYDMQTLVYSGNLMSSSSSPGGVSISVGLALGGAPTVGVLYGTVANLVSLVANSTNGSIVASVNRGHGLFEFPVVGTGAFGDAVASSSGLNASAMLTNATAIDQLAFKLNTGAIVNSVVSVGTGASTTVFVGGNFTYTSTSNSTSANVVAYAGTTAILAPNRGLAGPVTSLTELNGVLYAAGTFVATMDGTVIGLDGAAKWRYATAGSSWQSLGAVPSLGGSIAALGVLNTGKNDSIVAVGGGGNGLAFYDPVTTSFNSSTAGFVVGNLTAFGAAASLADTNATVYFAGNVRAALTNQAPGGALLSTSSSGLPQLTSLSYQLAAPSTGLRVQTVLERVRTPLRMSARSIVKDVVGMMLPRPTAFDSFAAAPVNLTLPSALSSSSAVAEVLAGAFWQNGTSTAMILGGSFTSSTGVRNVGLYDVTASTFKPLVGETITGAVTALAVIANTVWIGGSFSTATGRQGLTQYDLTRSVVNETSPALQGYTGSNASVNAIRERPGFDSTVIVAGAFAAAGSLPCQSICSWDTTTLQWTSLGSGLQGVVGAIDFAGTDSNYLIAAGSFSIEGTPAYVAQWDFKNQTWSSLGSGSAVPGPATALSADIGNDAKIFVAGTSTNNVPYVYYWNGTAWSDVNNGTLGAGSGVQQLAFVPLQNTHDGNSIIESDRMLLVSGALTINSTSVSSALYDGSTWYPYLVAQTASGGAGVVSNFFYSVQNFTLSGARHLAVGLVILISIAIGLGIVFLLVFIGLLIALSRRSEETVYPVPARDVTDTRGQHRPTSLLATVGAATAVLLDGKNEKQSKQRDLTDHTDESYAGPMSFDGGQSYDDQHFEADAASRARYSFTGEHPGELSVASGENLTILEASDANWWLVSNSAGQRGLIPCSYLF